MNALAIVPQEERIVETAATAAAAQAKALVESRYIMAMRRPRDIDVARERLLKDCKRPSFAAGARYVKPIGKDRSKWPSGPSIRFAEAAIRALTNIAVDTMALYDDREKRIVRVTVCDLEANTAYAQDVSITKTIERRHAKEGDVVLRTRTNSYGDTVYILEATDDDILNKQAALISKAIRTVGLRLIPGDLVDECMAQVVKTQAAEDAVDPDAARKALFDAFGTLGVRIEQLKEFLGHDGTHLEPAERLELKAIYAAIRDGETTWRDAMEARTDGDAGKVKQPVAKPKAVADVAPITTQAAPDTSEERAQGLPLPRAAEERKALGPQQVKVLAAKAKAAGKTIEEVREAVGGLYEDNIAAAFQFIERGQQ